MQNHQETAKHLMITLMNSFLMDVVKLSSTAKSISEQESVPRINLKENLGI